MITQEQSVGEVAAISLGAVRVFENHGIDYCCGGKRPLGDVCREQNVDFATLQQQLETATRDNGAPVKDWAKEPLRDLIHHIVTTHHEYLKLEMPRINDRMNKVLNAHGDKDPERLAELAKTYGGLYAELDQHMHKEEMVLFPAIERYEAVVSQRLPAPPLPFGTFQNPVAMMEMEHDNAGEALRRIKELTNNYELPDYACPTYRALYQGFEEMESDLHQHIHLENNILFPRSIELEKVNA